MNRKLAPEDDIVTRVIVRMNATTTGLVVGLLLGSLLFLATLWLVIKGGPRPGPHLALLAQYFPGYSVTLSGGVIGFLYAFAIGFVSGSALGALYNRIAR